MFSKEHPAFAAFLGRLGGDSALGDDRFVPRNFLLDEGVCSERSESYSQLGATADHGSLAAWSQAHERYLERYVHLEQPLAGPPSLVDQTDFRTCPETFRHDGLVGHYRTADGHLLLVRVENVKRISEKAERTVDDLMALAEKVISGSGPDTAPFQELHSALYRWNSRRELRPAYVVFWEDVRDVLDESADIWPDRLRDRLGLCHYDPPAREPIPIFVFRYEVKSLPKLRNRGDARPLAVPTVLDGPFSPAFCPAPKGERTGSAVDLSASLEQPAREVLHPFIRLGPDRLFRAGRVRRPVPRDLATARAAHLLLVQEHCDRDDYAVGTDSDIL